MKAAVIVPLYKTKRTDLYWYEPISLQRCFEVFGGHYPIKIIAPEGWSCDYLPSRSDYTIETFEPEYFKGKAGYNALMLRPHFYRRFADYDYILIYQLDAFAFSDRLEEFCRLGYDYIGAPWPRSSIGARPKPALFVGNGGFSLRNVKSCFNILSSNAELIDSLKLNEDAMFSYFGGLKPNEFRVAPLGVASQFSVEHQPERYCRKNGNVLPFGCHGFYALSSQFFIRAFAEVGYDLTPFAHVMMNCDLASLEQLLRQFLLKRLNSRINNGYSIKKYLPSNENFFVCLANEKSKILVEKLYYEGLPIINLNKIPLLSNENQLKAMLNTCIKFKTRGLILSLTDDSPIVSKISSLAGRGYNNYCLSFWQEYAKASKILLWRMSRPTVNRLHRK